MGAPRCFALLADLHLSDLPTTSTYHALQWAIGLVERERPEFLAVAGDVTTYGTGRSTALFLAALRQVQVPVFFTPGNAERRSPEALSLLGDLLQPGRRLGVLDDLLAVFPDTSTGSLPAAEREWLERAVAEHAAAPRRIVVTHYPLKRLGPESRTWLERWLAQNRVELLAAGHTHVHSVRDVGGCVEVVTRGLDPDKAIGDLPGISFFTSSRPGKWTEAFRPWRFGVELLPADLPAHVSPVGWSIHGDPVEAAGETLDLGLSCLELRPRDLDFPDRELAAALQRLRDSGPLFLSYHLPSLRWDEDSGRIEGEERLKAHLERALAAGVDSLTVHVPQAPARQMEADGSPTALYGEFVERYARLFTGPARVGVRIAVENIHNKPGTPVEAPERRFATTIDEYLRWLDAVDRSMAGIPQARVGAHLDVGHARNNGGPLDNLQPLSDWYARLGRRILGYHIHQVGRHPETGELANHLEIESLFGRRISFAGFIWAWSTHQITRGPLFVEVRGEEARRRTVARLRRLFDAAGNVGESVELPDASEEKSYPDRGGSNHAPRYSG